MLEGLGMENVCTIYAHLEYIAAIWYILCFYAFPRFGILNQEKSGNPELDSQLPQPT
jgi:hypothetical protein